MQLVGTFPTLHLGVLPSPRRSPLACAEKMLKNESALHPRKNIIERCRVGASANWRISNCRHEPSAARALHAHSTERWIGAPAERGLFPPKKVFDSIYFTRVRARGYSKWAPR